MRENGTQPDWRRYLPAMLGHDFAIVAANFRAVVSNRLDLLTVIIVLPILALVARAWLSDLPEDSAELVCAFIACGAAFVSARLAIARVRHHRTDGVIVRHAFSHRSAALYGGTLCIGAAALAGILAIGIGVFDLIWWAAGVVLGAAFAVLLEWFNHAVPSAFDDALASRIGTRLDAIRNAPLSLSIAGLFCGAVILLLPFTGDERAALALIAALGSGLISGRVDAEEVRYRTMVGQTSGQIIARHVKPGLAFPIGLALPLALTGLLSSAVSAAAIGVALAVLIAFRVLAYRVHGRQMADWVVTFVVGAVVMVAISLPLAAPVVTGLALIFMARRAHAQTWLLS